MSGSLPSYSVANYVHFTNVEFIVLLTLGSTSCFLSIFGSITIMHLVCKREDVWRDKQQLYHRIMLGLSFMDIISSTAIFLSPYLNRKDTNLFYARGNIASCDWGTFFFQFHFGSVAYNCALSIYFVRTIRYGKKSGTGFLCELLMHCTAICIPLTIGITGMLMKMFNPLPYLGFCGIGPYPWTCDEKDEVNCERGTSAPAFRYVYVIFYFIMSSIGIISTWLVYWTIRQQGLRNARWSPGGPEERQRRQTRAVGMQAIWYTAAFSIGFISNMCLAVLNSVFLKEGNVNTTSVLYGGSVFMFALFPLQGFFNGLIYIRPRVIRWKDANTEKSWLWAYGRALSGAPLPASQLSSRAIVTRANRSLRSVARFDIEATDECLTPPNKASTNTARGSLNSILKSSDENPFAELSRHMTVDT